MIRRLVLLSLACASLALPLCARAAEVTEVAGVKYENSVALTNTRLALNGAGIRYKFIRVYTAGLYLTTKAATYEAVVAAPGPKRMEVHMLRDIDANEFGKLLTRGLELNASREEFSRVIPGVIKLGEIFGARRKLLSGDYFYIDYVPNVGSIIAINGKPAIEPIKEPEFFNALMKIWLGNSPADAQLKDALLGKSANTRSNDPFVN